VNIKMDKNIMEMEKKEKKEFLLEYGTFSKDIIMVN